MRDRLLALDAVLKANGGFHRDRHDIPVQATEVEPDSATSG
jgi:hypothetical protein